MAIFKGAGVAIVTPMKENLEINYDKLDEMLEEQRELQLHSCLEFQDPFRCFSEVCCWRAKFKHFKGVQ